MTISRRKIILGTAAGVALASGAALTPLLRREGTWVETPSRALPVASDTTLPKSADVVIIGGGIQGVCSALFLAERGLSVVICEKGEIAGEQSGRAYSQIISWELETSVVSLTLHSKQLWRGMNERIGADTSYRTQGRVQTYSTDEGLEHAREWVKRAKDSIANPEDLKARFIEGEELQQRIPGAKTPWKAGGLEEDAGSVDPENGVPMIARYLKTKGVRIFTNCAVRGLDMQAGRVAGVITEKGAIRASTVVLAGGVWSRMFLGNYGMDLRTLLVYLWQQRLSAVPGAPEGNGHIGDGVFWRKQADGTYANGPRVFVQSITRDSFELLGDFYPYLAQGGMEGLPSQLSLNSDLIHSLQEPRHWSMDEVSPFEKIRIGAPSINHELLDLGLQRLRAEFPVFEQSKVLERWGGAASIPADLAPVISPVDDYPGLIINTAHTFGMTQGPAAGELVADMITGAKLRVDPTPYRFSRFAT